MKTAAVLIRKSYVSASCVTAWTIILRSFNARTTEGNLTIFFEFQVKLFQPDLGHGEGLEKS
jgi:hypothetical protein